MLTQMDCFGLTDVGCKRPTNQDHYLIADLNKSMCVHDTSLTLDSETRVYGGSQGKLLIVADGMGGEAAGERACTIAVDQVTTYVLNSLAWCFRLEEGSEHDFEDDLKQALESCQKSIETVVGKHPEMKSMGTTMTMVYIVWPRAFVVHVGDSRCYLLRDRQLDQITVDHTMSEIMAETGQMSRDEARHSSMGHVLWNVLGGRSNELSVDVYKLTLECDDILLLCTDGLYDMVPHEKLQELLNSNTSAESACRKLVDLANENDGRDNITVIVSHFLSPQLDEPRAFVEAEVPLEELTAASSDTFTKLTSADFQSVAEPATGLRPRTMPALEDHAFNIRTSTVARRGDGI
jgi:PPM family protein phosphatase